MKPGDLIMDNETKHLGMILKKEHFANMDTGPVFLIQWIDPPGEELYFIQSWRTLHKVTLLSESP